MGTINGDLASECIRISQPFLNWILVLSIWTVTLGQGLVPVSGRTAGSWAALAGNGAANRSSLCCQPAEPPLASGMGPTVAGFVLECLQDLSCGKGSCWVPTGIWIESFPFKSMPVKHIYMHTHAHIWVKIRNFPLFGSSWALCSGICPLVFRLKLTPMLLEYCQHGKWGVVRVYYPLIHYFCKAFDLDP